ncbi:MAG: DUF2283 domain-containing protein [Nitrososphaerota archaeon]|nr:DUF2283 domain-containing protein [Candidatus Aenigmarchaeota archaeon]MDW8034441.1 DUF2283 domain-containing protein [Nitrososphaerota archaeon]
MGNIFSFHKRDSDKLYIFFGNNENEVIYEENGEGIIFNKNGKVIGIEKLYISKSVGFSKTIPVEVVVA